MSAEDVRAIAEEALSEHDGWYRFRDRRRRTDEIHALARAYLEAEVRLARLEAENRMFRRILEIAPDTVLYIPSEEPVPEEAKELGRKLLAFYRPEVLAATEEGGER